MRSRARGPVLMSRMLAVKFFAEGLRTELPSRKLYQSVNDGNSGSDSRPG